MNLSKGRVCNALCCPLKSADLSLDAGSSEIHTNHPSGKYLKEVFVSNPMFSKDVTYEFDQSLTVRRHAKRLDSWRRQARYDQCNVSLESGVY